MDLRSCSILVQAVAYSGSAFAIGLVVGWLLCIFNIGAHSSHRDDHDER